MNPQIQNQESMLRESIKHFLTSYHSGSSDFSSFESIFFRLIQTMLDPPLEITWFYSAVTFHAAKSSSRDDPSARVLIAKDLMNLLISCSNLSSASKKIALLAPVVYGLYNIVYDSWKSGACVKSTEVDNLVENMVSYAVISAGVYDYESGDAKCDNVVVCFEDLVRVWTADRGGGNCNFGENLRVFFPLLADGNLKGLNSKCGIRELVAIVLCEVFFLRLYLKFCSGMCTEEFLKDTRDQAVQTIKGFRNFHFLDMLLKMLLEPSLPVAALLSPEDAGLLHKTLYDAVILVDYSFYSGRPIQSSDSYAKKLALVWILVVDRAIQFARDIADQTRAISYLNAFRESELVVELIKWVRLQAGTMDQNTRPVITSPEALIKWLLNLEDKGIRIFDRGTSVIHAKAVKRMSGVHSESPELNQNIFVPDRIDLNRDQEMGDLSDNVFPGTPLTISKIDASRKRKEALSGVQESKVKQAKCNLSGNFVGGNFFPFPSDSACPCANEVINISSDDDMEFNE